MSLIYITGLAASGKSTVRHELLKRGHIVLGGSEDGLAGFYDDKTGKPVLGSTHLRNKPGWLSEHSWILPRSTVLKLRGRAQDKIIFVCTSAANDREIWDDFDQVILLELDETIQQQRLRTRASNDWGKTTAEREYIHRDRIDHIRLFGELPSVRMDATRPVSEIVDDILQLVA